MECEGTGDGTLVDVGDMWVKWSGESATCSLIGGMPCEEAVELVCDLPARE